MGLEHNPKLESLKTDRPKVPLKKNIGYSSTNSHLPNKPVVYNNKYKQPYFDQITHFLLMSILINI